MSLFVVTQLAWSIILCMAAFARADLYYPQMIHLSLTGLDGEMAVDWISSCPDGEFPLALPELPSGFS